MGIKENYHQNAEDFLHQLNALKDVSHEVECAKIMEDYGGLKILCQAWQQTLFNINWPGNSVNLNITVSTIMRNLLAVSDKLKDQIGTNV